MINAEELNVTSANVDRVREGAGKPEVRGLLDLDGRFAKRLGLAALVILVEEPKPEAPKLQLITGGRE